MRSSAPHDLVATLASAPGRNVCSTRPAPRLGGYQSRAEVPAALQGSCNIWPEGARAPGEGECVTRTRVEHEERDPVTRIPFEKAPKRAQWQVSEPRSWYVLPAAGANDHE